MRENVRSLYFQAHGYLFGVSFLVIRRRELCQLDVVLNNALIIAYTFNPHQLACSVLLFKSLFNELSSFDCGVGTIINSHLKGILVSLALMGLKTYITIFFFQEFYQVFQSKHGTFCSSFGCFSLHCFITFIATNIEITLLLSKKLAVHSLVP